MSPSHRQQTLVLAAPRPAAAATYSPPATASSSCSDSSSSSSSSSSAVSLPTPYFEQPQPHPLLPLSDATRKQQQQSQNQHFAGSSSISSEIRAGDAAEEAEADVEDILHDDDINEQSGESGDELVDYLSAAAKAAAAARRTSGGGGGYSSRHHQPRAQHHLPPLPPQHYSSSSTFPSFSTDIIPSYAAPPALEPGQTLMTSYMVAAKPGMEYHHPPPPPQHLPALEKQQQQQQATTTTTVTKKKKKKVSETAPATGSRKGSQQQQQQQQQQPPLPAPPPLALSPVETYADPFHATPGTAFGTPLPPSATPIIAATAGSQHSYSHSFSGTPSLIHPYAAATPTKPPLGGIPPWAAGGGAAATPEPIYAAYGQYYTQPMLMTPTAAVPGGGGVLPYPPAYPAGPGAGPPGGMYAPPNGGYPHTAPVQRTYTLTPSSSSSLGYYAPGMPLPPLQESPVRPKKAAPGTGRKSRKTAGGGGSISGEQQMMPPMMAPPYPVSLPPIPEHVASHRRSSSSPSMASTSTASSSASAVAAVGTRKRTRTLDIKQTANEGRRLVFPAPSTQDEVDDDDAGEVPTVSAPLIGAPVSATLPSTPPRQIRRSALAPRVVQMPAITTTPRGTASIGVKDVLRSDLAWLQGAAVGGSDGSERRAMAACSDSSDEGEVDVFGSRFGGGGASSATSGLITRSADRLTRSERKRKRLDAFRAATAAAATAATPLPAGESPTATTTMTHLRGYGRMACGKATALRFLGEIDDERVEAEESRGGRLTPPMRRSMTSQATASGGVPEWPDEHFPWAGDDKTRRRRQDKVAAVVQLERLDHIGKFLDSVSDDDERDDRRGLGDGATASDARDALLAIQKDGLPVFAAGQIRVPTMLDAMAGQSIEETGCLCGGAAAAGGEMVCCEKCSTWYHLACCGIQNSDELDEKWLCWRCEPKNTSNIRDSPVPSALHTPRMRHAATVGSSASQTFANTAETTRSYHAHSSDAPLAPSPVFSPSGKMASLLDTPAPLYNTPRIPSTSSFFKTPGTPSSFVKQQQRIASYAEHYNVCQTPGGGSDGEYQKIYSTPKFEDFYGATPTAGNPSSPTPSRRARVFSSGGRNPLFTTPTSSQNFFRTLHSGATSASTPDLDHMSSAGASFSPYPVSPGPTAAYPPRLNPAITDLSTPSPLRGHKRQVSFGRVAFASASSSLRESMSIDDKPMKLEGPIGAEITPKRMQDRRLSDDEDILPAPDFD